MNDLNDASEKDQIAAVKRDWIAIKKIKNPSEAAQIAAVKYLGRHREGTHWQALLNYYGHPLQYIRHQSEKVQLVAVKNSAAAKYYLKNPSEKVLQYIQKEAKKHV